MCGAEEGYHKIDLFLDLPLEEMNIYKKMEEKSERFTISYSLFELCMQS
jgi:hypothetical protein